MLHPTDEQLAVLEGFERTAFRIADVVNRRPLLKRVAQAFLASVGKRWVHYCTRHLQHVEGLEQFTALRPDRGVMLVSNHRSFFDMYVLSSIILRKTQTVERMYFPVRGDFFYERASGVAVNAAMAAMAMYPPVMRDARKRAFNQYAVDFLAEELQRPGTLVGFHPEGRRSKGADPYALLPTNVGVGQIVYAAKPVVVPVFILGLSNDLPRQIRGNFDGTGAPITAVFGAPLDLAEHYAQAPRLRTYKHIADKIHASIVAVGARERALRAERGLPCLAPASASPVTATAAPQAAA